jgi:hypothetical protein
MLQQVGEVRIAAPGERYITGRFGRSSKIQEQEKGCGGPITSPLEKPMARTPGELIGASDPCIDAQHF